MRRLALPTLVLALLALGCASPTTTLPASAPEAEGDAPSQATSDLATAPDFTIDTLDGGTFTLSEQTLPVVLNFWAPW